MLLLLLLYNNRFRATCCDSERPYNCENINRYDTWFKHMQSTGFCNIDFKQRKVVFQLSLGFGISELGSRVQRF